MNLSKVTNPFKTHASPAQARNPSLEGMPLHQRQLALKKEVDSAKANLDGMKSGFKDFRWGATPEQNRRRTEYNAAGIRYERANWELESFTKENKAGLKAEAQAGPSSQPMQGGDGTHRHPTCLIPGHPDSAPKRQEFHPELFLQSPLQSRRDHPSALIPGHPDSAPQRAGLPPELSFMPAQSSPGRQEHQAVNAGRTSGRSMPAGSRPMPSDGSPAAHLAQARYNFRAQGNRVREPEIPGAKDQAPSPRAGSPDSSYNPQVGQPGIPVQDLHAGGPLRVTNPDPPSPPQTPIQRSQGRAGSAPGSPVPNYSRPFAPGDSFTPERGHSSLATSHLQRSREALRQDVGHRRSVPSPGAEAGSRAESAESAESFPMRPPKTSKWYNPFSWGK